MVAIILEIKKPILLKREAVRENLASDGGVGSNLGVAVGDEVEIDGGDKSAVNELIQIIDDEIGAIRTERLIVEIERDLSLVLRRSGGNRWKIGRRQGGDGGGGGGDEQE